MYYVQEFDIYVDKIEDLRDKISEDLYETLEKLIDKETESIDILKEETEVYEAEVEYLRYKLNDISSLSDKIEQDIDNLIDYIINTKRINRREIESELNQIFKKVRNIQDISTSY